MTVQEEIEYQAVVSAGPEAVRRYKEMVAAGESHRMAVMLATRKPPGSGVDDRMIFANTPSVSEQFAGCPEMLALYRKNYRQKTGEDLPEDAVVYRSLVEYPGDPGAIVTHKHSLDQVKEEMRRRNVTVEGDWENHQRQAPPEPQKILINDVAMARYKSEYRQLDEFRDVSDRDLEDEITSKHAKTVTPDEAMNAPRTVDDAWERAVQACSL